jgi:hypothetical protein
MADLLRPQFLRDRWKAQQGIDLAVGEQLHGLIRGIRHEIDVAARVQPDIGRHAGEEDVVR